VIWRPKPAQAYQDQIRRFLQRLLLLCHITAGQPARATELLSLRHSNTVNGRHRSIFIEHGLVSLVTSYHKGYSMTNSIKIIHRYLPKEVSELLVYYLWLILPFAQTIEMMANQGRRRNRNPFLWPKAETHWDPSSLRGVLEEEAQQHLRTKLNVISWRHAAIAISRMHLTCGGFKRDYNTDDAIVDQQASHGSWAAGTIYARGLQEAPGHIEMRRVRYREISREWHSFLGFESGSQGQKRKLVEGEQGNQSRAKRRQPYALIELSEEL
jgi:hypothetical protein